MKKSIILNLSAIAILLSAVVYMFVPQIAVWIMIAGVCIFSSVIASTPYQGKSIRGKRLFYMQMIACAMMFIASYLMFQRKNEWVVAMFVAAILLLYTSFFIPKELSKEENETNPHS